MSSTLCDHVLGLAKNTGVDRGTCSRDLGHKGRHGNRTCALCGGGAPRRNTYCRACRQKYAMDHRGAEAAAFRQLANENQQLKSAITQIVEEATAEYLSIGDIVVRVPMFEEIMA